MNERRTFLALLLGLLPLPFLRPRRPQAVRRFAAARFIGVEAARPLTPKGAFNFTAELSERMCLGCPALRRTLCAGLPPGAAPVYPPDLGGN